MTSLTPPPAHLATALAATVRRVPKLLTGLFALIVVVVVAHTHWTAWLGTSATTIATFVLALVIAGTTSLPTLVAIGWLGRRARKPLHMQLAVTLYGAVVATGLAMPLNELQVDLLGVPRGGFTTAEELPMWLFSSAIITPLIEEALKGLGILIILWRFPRVVESPRDGIIYGALIGVGFATVEYACYVLLDMQGGGPARYLYYLVLRLPLFGMSGHVVSTALVGAGLSLAAFAPPGRRGLLVGGYFLAGWLGHAIGNSFGAFATAYLALGLSGQLDAMAPVLAPYQYIGMWVGASIGSLLDLFLPGVLLVWQVLRTGEWEREVIAKGLADEVDTPVITVEEHAAAAHAFPLSTRSIQGVPRQRGRRLVDAQNKLALRKEYLRRAGIDPGLDLVATNLRAQIGQLR